MTTIKILMNKIQNAQRPVVVDFWAAWCGPCKMISPILKKLAKEYEGKIDFIEVNADESQAVLKELGVMGIPTLIVYQNGKEMIRQVGAKPASVYETLFKQLASGETVSTAPIAPFDRMLRLGLGLAILAYGALHANWWLVTAGGLVVFSGVYDRCPVWKAVTGWIKSRAQNP